MSRDLQNRLEAIIAKTAGLMAVLKAAREIDLPDWLVFSGAVYQPVWNHLTGRPLEYGLSDYDLAYFDGSDISHEAEGRSERSSLWHRERLDFGIAEHPSTGQEPPLAAIIQREHAAASWHGIDDQLGMAPELELVSPYIDRRPADLAQLHVALADDELALRVAHGRGAVTAAAGLVEEHRAVLRDQPFQKGQGGGGRGDPLWG